MEASQLLFYQRRQFLNTGDAFKTPFIIGIAGSVAVGKSTTARVLKELLARWPSSPKVDLVTTDGFLYPNEVLRAKGLMERKGFPESYDVGMVLRFLSQIKAGQRNVNAPLYSHLTYDVLPGRISDRRCPGYPDFRRASMCFRSAICPKTARWCRSCRIFSIFRSISMRMKSRYTNGTSAASCGLRETAFKDPSSFFHRYSTISDDSALAIGESLWANINLKNLRENILPTRPRADLILRKGDNHLVEEVALRKL